MSRRFCYSSIAAILLLFIALPAPAQKYQYPVPKRDSVVDDYHGTKVADPYRWMEDQDTPEIKDWIQAENALTRSYIDAYPHREDLKTRLTGLFNYVRYTVPDHEGRRYFFSRNDGLQNQSVLYMQDVSGGDSTLVLDPNTLSADGTVALSNQWYSDDGTLLAYGLSRSGSDQEEIHIKNLNTGKDYDEVLLWCKFTSVAWKKDNSGFFYNRYPVPDSVPKGEEGYNNRVYWHTLGTPQDQDNLVYEQPDARDLSFSPFTTEDGNYLVLEVEHGTDPQNRIYYREMSSNGSFIKLLNNADARYTFVANNGSTFYFNTDLHAPHGRIIAINVNDSNPGRWREIIPERTDPISFAAMVGNCFAVAYLHDAYHRLLVFNEEGAMSHEVELPAIGSVGGFSGKRTDSLMFFSFTSFLYPTTILKYDFATNTLSTFRTPAINFDPLEYETDQVFVPSKDGAKIPVFLTYKKGMKLDGNNPTLLYGYGGFNISMTPSFSSSRLVWLEHGGIYALACLRGGSEYGEEWHRAGMLSKKQNVFDDFIYAAKYLIDKNYTSTPKLAIQGGSNGGLLVAACLTQQPSLYGAAICQVPVADMLRFHKFTIGRFWTGEYGNAEQSAEQFQFMYAYSPLHNVKQGTTYPPTLITTADHDDRVLPAHAMKFAATLQAADAGVNPILVRVDTKAGHGGGKPTSKVIDEQADIYSFLFKTLNIPFER
jgi:prolyl oligopeptidase